MNKKVVIFLLLYTVIASLFYYVTTGNLITAIFRGTGIAGTTFLAFSLMITPAAMFIKELSKYIMLRIESGIVGVLVVMIHVVVLFGVRFKFDLLSHINDNVLLAGVVAILIYLAVLLTTGTNNMKKLGFGKWKTIQRLVYIAFPLSVYHFWVRYSHAIFEPFGIVLLLFTIGAIGFQIAGAAKTISKKR